MLQPPLVLSTSMSDGIAASLNQVEGAEAGLVVRSGGSAHGRKAISALF